MTTRPDHNGDRFAGSMPFGFMLAATGMLMLPVGDAIAKHLAGLGLHPLQIAWGRWLAHFVLLTPIALYFHGPSIWWPRSAWIQILRACLMCVATVAYFTALRSIRLADAAAVLFVAPIIMTALSGLLLGEKVGVHRWLAVVAGFAGVLLIVQPGAGVASWGASLAVVAAICFAVYFLLTRKVAHHNPSLVTIWFMGAVGTVVMTPLVPPFWQAVSLQAWAGMAAIGAVMALGHLLIIKGLQHVEASAAAPLPYLELVTATALGYYWFSEFPGIMTWIGCGIVVAAGLYIARREQQQVRSPAAVGVKLSGVQPTETLDIAAAQGNNRSRGDIKGISSGHGRRGKGVGFMRSVLNILAVALIGAGVAAGVFSFLSPGSVILGLNLGVAATLLTGGFILLGLNGVMATLENLMDAVQASGQSGALPRQMQNEPVAEPSMEPERPDPAIAAVGGLAAAGAAAAAATSDAADQAVEATADAAETASEAVEPMLEAAKGRFEGALETATEAAVPVAEAAESVAEVVDDATEAVADTAEAASDAASEQVEAAVETVAETAEATVETAEEVVAESAETTMESAEEAVEDAAAAVEDVADAADETAGEAAEAVEDAADSAEETLDTAVEAVTEEVADAAEEVADVVEPSEPVEAPEPEPEPEPKPEPEPETEPEPEPEPEPEAAGEQPLYVIEEREIRGRPARMLSDGTVECETAEGWMRFENLEHLDEYLDAMGG